MKKGENIPENQELGGRINVKPLGSDNKKKSTGFFAPIQAEGHGENIMMEQVVKDLLGEGCDDKGSKEQKRETTLN